MFFKVKLNQLKSDDYFHSCHPHYIKLTSCGTKFDACTTTIAEDPFCLFCKREEKEKNRILKFAKENNITYVIIDDTSVEIETWLNNEIKNFCQ